MIICARCGGTANTSITCQGNSFGRYICTDCGAHLTNEGNVIPARHLTCEHKGESYKQMCRACGFWLPDCGCATGMTYNEGHHDVYTLAWAREHRFDA